MGALHISTNSCGISVSMLVCAKVYKLKPDQFGNARPLADGQSEIGVAHNLNAILFYMWFQPSWLLSSLQLVIMHGCTQLLTGCSV